MKKTPLKKKERTFFEQSKQWLDPEPFIIPNLLGKSSVQLFSQHIAINGGLLKNKILLSRLFKNFNYLVYNNSSWLYSQYPTLSNLIENILFKKYNYLYSFDHILNLVKPPFIVKSVNVPKKIRKKTRVKFITKIVYRNESKRMGSAFKQLFYYSNKFFDSKFEIRLYKALSLSLFEWKNSHLFKLKTMIFKKYLKM